MHHQPTTLVESLVIGCCKSFLPKFALDIEKCKAGQQSQRLRYIKLSQLALCERAVSLSHGGSVHYAGAEYTRTTGFVAVVYSRRSSTSASSSSVQANQGTHVQGETAAEKDEQNTGGFVSAEESFALGDFSVVNDDLLEDFLPAPGAASALPSVCSTLGALVRKAVQDIGLVGLPLDDLKRLPAVSGAARKSQGVCFVNIPAKTGTCVAAVITNHPCQHYFAGYYDVHLRAPERAPGPVDPTEASQTARGLWFRVQETPPTLPPYFEQREPLFARGYDEPAATTPKDLPTSFEMTTSDLNEVTTDGIAHIMKVLSEPTDTSTDGGRPAK